MRLADYLERNKVSQSQFASLFDGTISPGLVSHWINGTTKVSPQRCVEIERLTGGEVSRIVLRPDDWHRIWPELAAANPELVPPSAAAPAQQEAA